MPASLQIQELQQRIALYDDQTAYKELFARFCKSLQQFAVSFVRSPEVAEEIVSDDISTGATGDIQQATQLSRAMVCQWGMSDKLGMVQ